MAAKVSEVKRGTHAAKDGTGGPEVEVLSTFSRATQSPGLPVSETALVRVKATDREDDKTRRILPGTVVCKFRCEEQTADHFCTPPSPQLESTGLGVDRTHF